LRTTSLPLDGAPCCDHRGAVSHPAVPQPAHCGGVGFSGCNNSCRAVGAPCGVGFGPVGGSVTGCGAGQITGPPWLQLAAATLKISTQSIFTAFRIFQVLAVAVVDRRARLA